jgi:hypothetical protein
MKFFYSAAVCLGLALLSGCATAPTPEALTIQGTWKGQEVRDGHAESSWLLLSSPDVDFKGVHESYRGTYTVNENANPKQLTAVITQCSDARYVGKTANAIYKLIPGRAGHDTLIITGNEPGDPEMPSGFGDRHARQIVFTRD